MNKNPGCLKLALAGVLLAVTDAVDRDQCFAGIQARGGGANNEQCVFIRMPASLNRAGMA
jgi:hypothetical protein